MLTIPLPSDSDHFSFTVELDRVTYTFVWLWSPRDSSWYFSLYDATGALLLGHRKAVVEFPLLARFHRENLPRGRLLLSDTANTFTDPGLTDLGNRVQLYYMPAAEL